MPQNTGPAFGPQDYSTGPFSDQLKPPAPTQIPVPGGKISRPAAAAALIDKFLEGVTTGRVRAFENQERQRSQKRGALDSAYNQIRQDYQEGRVTQEGYQKATQVYFRSIGNIGAQTLDQGDDQTGKKKTAKKKADDTPQTPADHIKGMAKTLFTGMAGGKLTPGVDVGSALIDMQNSVYAKDGNPLPQYNTKSQVADIQNKIQQIQNDMPAGLSWDLAGPRYQAKLDQYRFLDPQGADRKTKELQGMHPPTPTPPPPGSIPDSVLKARGLFAPGAQGQATALLPTTGSPTGGAVDWDSTTGLPRTSSATQLPPGAPQATGGPPPINGRQFAGLSAANMVGKPEKIEYIGADGKRTVGTGVRINVPNSGEFWYGTDERGSPIPINQKDVQPYTSQPTDAKPSEIVRIGPGQKDAFGKPVPEGALGRWMTINGKEGWYRTNESGPQAKTESAQRLYRDENHIADDKDLTARQIADADERWAVLTDPAKKAKYGPGTSAKALNKTANENPLFDIQAWDFLTKGTFDVRGIGKDAGQAADQITARAQQIMKDNGLSAGDVIALRAGVKADTGALARVTTQGATINQLEDQLSRNMAIAKKLDSAFKRSDTPFVNKVIAAFNTGTGDSDSLNLAAQLHAVSREWAKLMQGQTSAAGVSIKEAADTDKLISSGLSSGQLTSLFDNVISKDANTRSQAVNRERKRLVDSIRGALAPPGASQEDSTHPEDNTVHQNSGHDISWFLGGSGGGSLDSQKPAAVFVTDPKTGQIVKQ